MKYFLYTRVIIWVDTILNCIDTRAILPWYEGSCTVYTPEWYQIQNILKNPYPTGIKKCDILIVDTRILSKKVQ